MASSDAARELETLASKTEQLGRELRTFQENQIPDEDPASVAVAVPLGETLDRMYTLCTCNEELAATTDCESFRSMFEEQFDL